MHTNFPVVHSELWKQIDALELDDPNSPFPFSARLARDNGWSW